LRPILSDVVNVQLLVCDGGQCYRKAKNRAAATFLASINFNHPVFFPNPTCSLSLQTINKRLGII
jgi:hypothetical protein